MVASRLASPCLAAAGVLLAALAAPAAAELGVGTRTVDADRAHLAATITSTAAATHIVHTLTLANGGTVREFADAAGVVFAVAWAAPGRPDLRQLLGGAFADFLADVGAARRGRRQPLSVRRDDLVVHSAGHPGAFRGFAYLPSRLPRGFTAEGRNGASVTLALPLSDAGPLLLGDNAAVPGIGADPGSSATFDAFPRSFDLGLPFFFGRNVYVAIEGRTAGGSVGPYFAF